MFTCPANHVTSLGLYLSFGWVICHYLSNSTFDFETCIQILWNSTAVCHVLAVGPRMWTTRNGAIPLWLSACHIDMPFLAILSVNWQWRAHGQCKQLISASCDRPAISVRRPFPGPVSGAPHGHIVRAIRLGASPIPRIDLSANNLLCRNPDASFCRNRKSEDTFMLIREFWRETAAGVYNNFSYNHSQ
jgi:hypothetical protein